MEGDIQGIPDGNPILRMEGDNPMEIRENPYRWSAQKFNDAETTTCAFIAAKPTIGAEIALPGKLGTSARAQTTDNSRLPTQKAQKAKVKEGVLLTLIEDKAMAKEVQNRL